MLSQLIRVTITPPVKGSVSGLRLNRTMEITYYVHWFDSVRITHGELCTTYAEFVEWISAQV